MKVNITENGIETKGVLSKKLIPFEGISNAFLRIEEIEAKVCCGRANFDRSYLVLINQGKEEVIEMETKAQVKHILEILKEKVPNITIGKRA